VSESISPADPEVMQLARGLVAYLQEQLRASRRHVRDAFKGSAVFWLADVDHQLRLSDSPVLLEVAYQPPPNPPPPPADIYRWLDGNEWANIDAPPRLVNPESAETPTPDRIRQAYDDWMIRWQEWASKEQGTDAVRTCYERLDRLARESSQRIDTHELVLGIGLLSSPSGGGWAIRRHVLTWDIAVERDRTSDALRLVLPVDLTPRIEDRDFLKDGDGYRLHRDRSPWLDTDLGSLHPLSGEAVSWLEAWRTRWWDRHLPFDPQRWTPPRRDDGEVTRLTLAPAVFLRERDRSGLELYYAAIAASLDEPEARCPLGLAQLAAPIEPEQRLGWLRDSTEAELPAISEDPLLPLPTNREQRQVLDKLRTDSAVVVQGPPGTGKTHTIANLICALLAEGQRILVTSQKDQALRVLRNQLPDAVRTLCVLMTGMRAGSRDELDRSIRALSDLSTTSTPDGLQRDIARLRQQRGDLLSDLGRATRDLLIVREQEYALHPGVAPGYGGTLADLVRSINNGRDRHGWIDPLPPHAPGEPPLTNDEAQHLRDLLVTATPDRTTRAAQQLPPPQLVPAPSQVATEIAAVTEAERILGSDRAAAPWSLSNLSNALLAEMQRNVDQAADGLATCGLPDTMAEWDAADWRLNAVTALLARQNPAYWSSLFEEIADVQPHVHALASLNGHDVEIMPTANLTRLLGQAKRLRSYLSKGGRLRRFRPAQEQLHATDLMELCAVDGAAPTTVSDLNMLTIVLQAEIAVTAALEAWAPTGVPIAHGPLRRRMAQVKDLSHNAAAISKLVTSRDAIEHALRRNGIRYAIRTPADWDLVVRVVRAGPAMAHAQQCAVSLGQAIQTLTSWTMREQAAPEAAELAAALSDRDVAAYASAWARLEQARSDKAAQDRCEALTTRLTDAHRALTEHLRQTIDDPGWDVRLGSFEQAWSWGCAAAYHRTVRDPEVEQRLERRVDEIEQRLGVVTAELAGVQARLHWLSRLTERQRQALQSYRTAMGKFGQGQGSHRDRYLNAARDAMRDARQAVPAWVMPLSLVADTIPPQPNTFDVVIVDEASQAEVDSLFLLWLAPRIIAVGDDKQCAPGLSSATGLTGAENSVDHHLGGMRLYQRDAFSPTSNLYDLLSTRFPDAVLLSEHFRSMPEIIGWSSAQFYEDRLIPLRQFGADRLDPLKVVRVADAQEVGRDATMRNEAEAEAIIDQVKKLIEDPMYRGRTIGIIALHNCGQARLLDRLLNERIDPADIRRFDIRVGHPPDFQGDQRDIVLLSMVVTKAKRALTGRQEQRRYNVAASRARDQMWLFVSIPPDGLASGGLRHSLLTYMLNPPATLATDSILDEATEDHLQQPFESLLEQRVFLHLRRRGYAVVPQYTVDDRRVDLVVVGDNGRLAVECDTPDVPVSPEQLERDLRRERELRRAGWQFLRIRDSEYLFDPAGALDPLWQQLAQRDIEPRSLPAAPRRQVRWSPVPLSDDEDER
jgi:very-short-patch-repair endonuclease